MSGWAAEDILLRMESDTVSAYHALGASQADDVTDLPREYTTVMPHVGDVEPAYPLVVEPVCEHGAVELGWPGNFALLLPEVSAQVPERYTYVTTFSPTGARASAVERDDDNLTAEEM
eukprot:8514706-Lingulodinium_polyedra.AAC.1